MIESFSRSADSCPVCDSASTDRLYTLTNMPVFCNVLHDTRRDALNCDKGTIDLIFCNECGHIFNRAFDPALMAYSVEYENSLHFSKKFQEYAYRLASDLIKDYGIIKKNIIEIGCGKGDFLKIICDLGENKGFGFDASYIFKEEDKQTKNVTFYQEFYSNKYAHIKGELILCRHVLEHIHNPQQFIKSIQSAVRQSNPAFYFEVPNVLYTLRDKGIWDLIYEHYSYFNPHSLSKLLNKMGYYNYRLREVYNNQFLSVEFGKTEADKDMVFDPLPTLQVVTCLINNFIKSYEDKVNYWKDLLERCKNEGKNVVLWGGGSKGVTFLNVFHENDLIHEIVDINPRKQGKYVSGTGQKYISPKELLEKKYDTAIIMNHIYKQEISGTLKSMGLNLEILEA